jgi:hypothetical protein
MVEDFSIYAPGIPYIGKIILVNGKLLGYVFRRGAGCKSAPSSSSSAKDLPKEVKA